MWYTTPPAAITATDAIFPTVISPPNKYIEHKITKNFFMFRKIVVCTEPCRLTIVYISLLSNAYNMATPIYPKVIEISTSIVLMDFQYTGSCKKKSYKVTQNSMSSTLWPSFWKRSYWICRANASNRVDINTRNTPVLNEQIASSLDVQFTSRRRYHTTPSTCKPAPKYFNGVYLRPKSSTPIPIVNRTLPHSNIFISAVDMSAKYASVWHQRVAKTSNAILM